MKHYKLVNKVPVACEEFDASAWDIANRRVDKTKIGNVQVSTVFLCIDHSFESGEPVLFETMVFGGPLDGEMDRYCSWDDAVKGHAAIVQRVKDAPLENAEENSNNNQQPLNAPPSAPAQGTLPEAGNVV